MFRTKRYYKNQNTQLLNEINDFNTKTEKLKKENDNYKDLIKRLENTLKAREKDLKKCITDDIKHQEKIIKQKDEIKSKEKQIKDLEQKLEESMTDKYLVKKIPSGRTPRGQKIGVKSSTVQSKIIKAVKGVDNEE